MVNLATDPEIQEQLEENNLRYISDKSPGFFRQGSKKAVSYYDLAGKKITDKKILERISSLRIPPAWKQVWISPKANGHLQATGLDDRGRKQYIYHPNWIKISQENKFSKMVDFGLSLPKIRSRVYYDMQTQSLDKKRILATIIWLLEHTFIRVGNDEYSKENGSFGLTTLRNKHVDINGAKVTFQFKGKSGVHHLITVSNPKVVRTVKKCVEIPGFELFQYFDDKGDRHVIDSADVNLFLRDITQDDFTAKDFRTWGATNLSADNLYQAGFVKDLKAVNKNIVETVKKVAKHLNNTVSVCRNYYIHPTVIQTYQRNILNPHFSKFNKTKTKKSGLSWNEWALIDLLKRYS